MTWLAIQPEYQALFRALGWNSFETVTAHFGNATDYNGEALVRPATVRAAGQSLDLFYKQYRCNNLSWRQSKARREFHNYSVLSELGVPAAERVAAGEKRDRLGRVCGAWIMTKAVPQSETLVQFAQQNRPSGMRLKLAMELAGITRRMHQANFFYHDLVWRNILVSRAGDDHRLVLIDCPRGGFSAMRRRRGQLRDLAALDKLAVKYCRLSERLRFFLEYLGKERLDDEARALARACTEYRRVRWPDDWEGR